MDEIMSHVHTPLIDGLVKLQGMLPMKKKEYVDYISNNIILEVAYTEKGTVTKTSVAYALAMARAEAPAPEAYADDYAELKDAFELAKKSEESTKLIKEMDKELDEKAHERYATLTDDEIMDLLVNKNGITLSAQALMICMQQFLISLQIALLNCLNVMKIRFLIL